MFIAAIFTKFSQLILRKIIKIVAIRCQILRLKCTKFDFGWGSAPDPAEGAYRGGERGEWEGRVWEGKGKERKETHSGLDPVPLLFGGSTPMPVCYK